jgi:pheromone a factor receptor
LHSFQLELLIFFAVLTIIRLREHRGRLSSTISRTSSGGLDSRKFLKLFGLTILLLAIYLPVLGYFFYTNVREPFVPYSWNRIHNPLVWDQVLYFHSSDFPDVQYWPWIPIVFTFILFLWYGLAPEAIECYRRGLVFCGFAKIWPSLNEPYQPRRENRSNLSSRGSWVAKLDIFEKTAAYLDSSKNQKRQVTHVEQVTSPAPGSAFCSQK